MFCAYNPFPVVDSTSFYRFIISLCCFQQFTRLLLSYLKKKKPSSLPSLLRSTRARPTTRYRRLPQTYIISFFLFGLPLVVLLLG